MSNMNYNKMYDERKTEAQEQPAEPEVKTVIETLVDPVPGVDIQMAIEEVAEPEVLTPVEESEQPVINAVVVNCAKLNVREEPAPKAAVVAIIDASNEVAVYEDESFGNYYKVCTAAGIEGYCVKDYLQLK